MFELLPDPRGPLRIWERPKEDGSYVVGADTGGGKSSDDWCCACVLEADTRNQVASFRAHMEAADFGYAVWVLSRYYNFAFVVPEANNHGLVVVTTLRDMAHPHLYARTNWDAVAKRTVSTVGFVTTPKSRPILISHARKALADQRIKIVDPDVFKEMSTFIIGETGREDHLDGCHDDALFAWMLALEGCESVRGQMSDAAVAPKTGHRDDWVWDRMREMAAARTEERDSWTW